MGYKTSESCECQSARALSSSPRLFSTSLDVLSSFERWVQDKRHCLEQLGCQWRLKWLGRPQLTARWRCWQTDSPIISWTRLTLSSFELQCEQVCFTTTIINKSLWTLTGKTQTRFLNVFVFTGLSLVSIDTEIEFLIFLWSLIFHATLQKLSIFCNCNPTINSLSKSTK